MSEQLILEVQNLRKCFPIKRGLLRRTVDEVVAVDDVSFAIKRGETLGLVGESGCGKTTTGRCLIRAIEPTSGKVVYYDQDGQAVDLAGLSQSELRQLWKDIQYIFQDPYSSLNPRMTVREIVGEPFTVHGVAKGRELDERVAEILVQVGLRPEHMLRYPHAFSGGQRQRIGIARALALHPALLSCDEPVSALDVSVQAQILNLLLELQGEFGLTYLFISHDLSVVEHLCDRVAVMYLGRIVEMASTEELYAQPRHPYTETLMNAVLHPDPTKRHQRAARRGEIAEAEASSGGCSFAPRCAYASAECLTQEPLLRSAGSGEHLVACHHAESLNLAGAL